MKVPRTRSRTEMSCSETTANLESDEIVEPETEAISKEISEAPSLGNNSIKKYTCYYYYQLQFSQF